MQETRTDFEAVLSGDREGFRGSSLGTIATYVSACEGISISAEAGTGETFQRLNPRAGGWKVEGTDN